MMDLVFVRFAVRHEGSEEEPLAVYCASLGSLERGEYCLCFIFVGSMELMTFSFLFIAIGYRHLPLHDAQMSQYLFSTLFVQIDVHGA